LSGGWARAWQGAHVAIFVQCVDTAARVQEPQTQPQTVELLEGGAEASSALLSQILGCAVEATERPGPLSGDAVKVIVAGGAIARSAATLALNHCCAARRIGAQEPVAVLAACHARCVAAPASPFTAFWASACASLQAAATV